MADAADEVATAAEVSRLFDRLYSPDQCELVAVKKEKS